MVVIVASQPTALSRSQNTTMKLEPKIFPCALVGILFVLLHSASAHANERHFAFAYETATLPAGTAEIEPWLTTRLGRSSYFARLEYRLEYEVAVTDRLQFALYLNGRGSAWGDGAMRQESSEFRGSSLEVKYRLLDSTADPIGFGLYAEVTGRADEIEVETKLLLDRRFGNVLLAANLIYAHEWGFAAGGLVHENELGLAAGFGYFVLPELLVGAEFREMNVFSPASFDYSAIYFGPTVAFHRSRWWVAASISPQIAAVHGATAGDIRNLTDTEMLHARILLGIHL